MNKTVAFFTGLGVGAGAMFILDPDRGKRRRALMRDQCAHLANKSSMALGKTSRDLRNRVRGIVAESKAMFADQHVPDTALEDRIKAVLGRYPVHQRSIIVQAIDGKVMLSGETLAKELDTLLDAVKSVRGVNEVVNNLTVHQTAEGISSLQGEPLGAKGVTLA
ncbi:MAG: BON domain-containing protein [Pyrinomonadaceae bacterium]